MRRPEISVIVVTYQSRSLIAGCLQSIQAFAPPNTETIVVDNASNDGTAEFVAEAAPETVLIALERNCGFAAGSNRGAERARGRYLMFLNPDAELVEGALGRLKTYLDCNPRVAAVGPRFSAADGTPQDSAFSYPTLLMTWLEFFPWPARALHTQVNGRLTSPDGRSILVDHPLGAGMLVSRLTWDQVGPFDEGFFLYCEEVDWCMRAQALGWRIAHLPSANIIHHGGMSAAQSRASSLVWLYESRRRLHRKHRSRWFQAVAVFITHLGLAQEARRLKEQRPMSSDAAERLKGIGRVLGRR